MTDTVEIIFKGTDRFTGTVNSIRGSFRSLGNVVKGAAIAGVAGLSALGGAAVMGGKKLVELGSDAEETGSLIATSLGPATEGFNETLREMADDMNRSFFELQEGSSTIIAMTKSMGASEQEAADFGATFAGIASDLGSFFNRADTDVFLDLQAGLGGSSEVMQKYGVDIRETTLKQMALNQGLIASASDVLPRLVRTQLIQQAITEQAADAMGDAERTAGSWANSLRGLTSKLKDAATAAGIQLLPVVTPLLNTLGDLAEQAVPVLTAAFEGLLPYLEDASFIIRDFIFFLQEGQSPIQAIISSFNVWGEEGMALGEAFSSVVDWINQTIIKIQEFMEPVTAAISSFFEWKDVLIALGVVLGGVVLSAIISIGTVLAPIILALAAITAAVAVVRQVWENDWLGIRTALENFWNNIGLPIFTAVKEWLEVNIPIAIETLTGFWEGTLLPILQTVWEFLSVDMLPIWESLGEFLKVYFPAAITILKISWEGLKIGMQEIWSFIKDKLGPIFEWLNDKVIKPITSTFGGLEGAIKGVANWIDNLTSRLAAVSIPDWMERSSPSPIEQTFMGWRKELQELYRTDLPALGSAVQGVQNVNNQSRVINQSTTIYTTSVDTRGETEANMRFALGGI